ncbi:MAG: hypothetical protein AAGI01_18970, partial [Myxococcota bacterium]
LEVTDQRTSFEFAALLATGATLSADAEDLSGLGVLLDALRSGGEGWEALAAREGFSVPVAMVDEEMAGLMVEVAIHERTITHQGSSPGISGLPLVSNDPDEIDVDAAYAMLVEARSGVPAEEETVAVVRTLCDVRRWAEEDVTTLGRIAADHASVARLTEHPQPAIACAAKRAMSWLRPADAEPASAGTLGALTYGRIDAHTRATFEQAAVGESVAALFAAHALLEQPMEEAITSLARVWAGCAPVRADVVRALMVEALGS